MKSYLSRSWQRIPKNLRKSMVLMLGSLCIVASLLFGWLPGPGGIPLFLLGIAILSTEFAWAERFKQFVLGYLKVATTYLKHHRLLAVVTIACGVILSTTVTIWTVYLYNQSH